MKAIFQKMHQNVLKRGLAAAVAVLYCGQLLGQTPELNEARRLIENEQYSQRSPS